VKKIVKIGQNLMMWTRIWWGCVLTLGLLIPLAYNLHLRS